MLTRLLLGLSLATAPAFSAELAKADIERAGQLCAESIRPTLILNYEMQSIQLVYGEADRTACIKLLKSYAGQVELAASYHHVAIDTTLNPELLLLANSLRTLRLEETKLCANLAEPNLTVDTLSFLARSVSIGMNERDSVKASQLRNDLFLNSAMSHLGAQIKLNQDGKNIVAKEREAFQAILNFLSTHKDLEGNQTFEEPIRNLEAEHLKRGRDLADLLKSQPELLAQTLMGLSSSKLQWNFEPSDKVISTKVNDQKTLGICVVSDVTMTIQGQRAGVRTLNFKVAHQMNRVGFITVIGLN
jgi:hypothetical protein